MHRRHRSSRSRSCGRRSRSRSPSRHGRSPARAHGGSSSSSREPSREGGERHARISRTGDHRRSRSPAVEDGRHPQSRGSNHGSHHDWRGGGRRHDDDSRRRGHHHETRARVVEVPVRSYDEAQAGADVLALALARALFTVAVATRDAAASAKHAELMRDPRVRPLLHAQGEDPALHSAEIQEIALMPGGASRADFVAHFTAPSAAAAPLPLPLPLPSPSHACPPPSPPSASPQSFVEQWMPSAAPRLVRGEPTSTSLRETLKRSQGPRRGGGGGGGGGSSSGGSGGGGASAGTGPRIVQPPLVRRAIAPMSPEELAPQPPPPDGLLAMPRAAAAPPRATAVTAAAGPWAVAAVAMPRAPAVAVAAAAAAASSSATSLPRVHARATTPALVASAVTAPTAPQAPVRRAPTTAAVSAAAPAVRSPPEMAAGAPAAAPSPDVPSDADSDAVSVSSGAAAAGAPPRTWGTPAGRARARDELGDPALEAAMLEVPLPPRSLVARELGSWVDVQPQSYMLVCDEAKDTAAKWLLHRRLVLLGGIMNAALRPFVVGKIALDREGRPCANLLGIMARMRRGEYATFAHGGEARLIRDLRAAYAAAADAAPVKLRPYIETHGRAACEYMRTLALEEGEMLEEKRWRRLTQ